MKKPFQLMGILNVTPDSFYDGGKILRLPAALAQAKRMVAEGADFLDVGGESTRPGARPVALQEELRRVVPLLRRLQTMFPRIPLSVDTQKAEVARQALLAGATIINDVSALTADPEMLNLVLQKRARVILMHMPGNPQTMQRQAHYKNVTQEVRDYLKSRVDLLKKKGLPKEKIWIDPGLGFGKTTRHNLELLTNLQSLQSLGCPILLGHSRKFFIGRILGSEDKPLPPEERLEGSLAVACWAFMQGLRIFRVHDVAAHRKALQLTQAMAVAASREQA